jgi:hydroxypyruvate isomerase
MLENLNLPVDHPGVPFARVEDTLALVSSVDRPELRLNLDLYQVQIGEGNLIEWCRNCQPWAPPRASTRIARALARIGQALVLLSATH